MKRILPFANVKASRVKPAVKPAVKPYRPALSARACKVLVAIEYSMVAVGGSLQQLARDLKAAADDLPECVAAARKVRRLRRLLYVAGDLRRGGTLLLDG